MSPVINNETLETHHARILWKIMLILGSRTWKNGQGQDAGRIWESVESLFGKQRWTSLAAFLGNAASNLKLGFRHSNGLSKNCLSFEFIPLFFDFFTSTNEKTSIHPPVDASLHFCYLYRDKRCCLVISNMQIFHYEHRESVDFQESLLLAWPFIFFCLIRLNFTTR